MTKKIMRYCCFLLAIYLLNCSVDAPDIGVCKISEDLTHNEQESFLELILEKALGLDNLIPEADDADHDEETGTKKSIHLDLFIAPVNDNRAAIFQPEYCSVIFDKKITLLRCCPELLSPPPEI
jgi:hypothetical protein